MSENQNSQENYYLGNNEDDLHETIVDRRFVRVGALLSSIIVAAGIYIGFNNFSDNEGLLDDLTETLADSVIPGSIIFAGTYATLYFSDKAEEFTEIINNKGGTNTSHTAEK